MSIAISGNTEASGDRGMLVMTAALNAARPVIASIARRDHELVVDASNTIVSAVSATSQR